jgi:hypothetical protein
VAGRMRLAFTTHCCGLLLALFLSSQFAHVASAQAASSGSPFPDCLYSFGVGPSRVVVSPCSGDTAKVGENRDVLAVMRFFGIPREAVSFRSCPGGKFSARPDWTTPGKYQIQYPADSNSSVIAPIVHELAHVVQMRTAGSLEALGPDRNIRLIELGADFLAGLAFNQVLKHLNTVDFETNLKLVGAYELSRSSHGTPEHRTQAFRLGATRASPLDELTIHQALQYFNANDYARVTR